MPTPHVRSLRPLFALLALLAFAPPSLAQEGPAMIDPAEAVGTWEGEIGPGTLSLGVVVEFELVGGDAFSGTIDIPAQGAVDLPLAVLSLEPDAFAFAIEGVPGEPTFTGALDGDRIEGTFTQGGQELPFELTRTAAGAEAPSQVAEAEEPEEPAEPAEPVPDADVEAFAGAWRGAIASPQIEQEIVVRLEPAESGGWSGTVDIPAQGLTGLPLTELEIGGERARFRIANAPGGQTFDGTLTEADGVATLSGTFTVGGQELPFTLERASEEDVAAAGRRPQDPVPPFPYEEVELTWEGPAGAIAGTLTLPEGEGPFPAVLMITGSGPQDRDESLMGHRPFRVIADALARAGIASLRADDRGVGGTEGVLDTSTYDDLTADALAGLDELRSRPEIDPERVGLFGHSEGGYLAPIVADRADGDVAFTVLMAAPAVEGLEVLRLQNRLIFEAAGAPEGMVEDQMAYLDAWGEALRAGDLDVAAELTRERVREAFASMPDAPSFSPEEIEAQAEAQASATSGPYFRSFLLYDPQPYLRRLDVPTLALYGRLDLQVPAVQNAGRMSGALRVAGNPDFEVVTLPGLNHLMQPATSGGIDEYATIETTIAPEALELITSWIAERFVR